MQVLIFQSRKGVDVIGFTDHPNGSRLPFKFGPWKPVGDAAIQIGANLPGIVGGSGAVLTGIEAKGYFLARSKIHITGPARH